MSESRSSVAEGYRLRWLGAASLLGLAGLVVVLSLFTGSADIGPFQDTPELTADDRRAMEQGKVRKHTWIAGWFPLDDPKAVLVVYMHDVSETASHTSVYVAAQFLRSAAVQKFVEDARTSQARGGDEQASKMAGAPSHAKEQR